MNTLQQCVLTGYKLNKPVIIDGLTATYEFEPVGKVIVALPTFNALLTNRQVNNPILAGICRNAHVKGEAPPLINTQFMQEGFKAFSHPKTAKEKARHLLKYIYEHGGKDFKKLSFYNAADYTLCYCEDYKEFSAVIEHLKDRHLIKWHSANGMARDLKRYADVQLTESGMAEVEKDLPNLPMIGLATQDISTGDSEVDAKINHAKALFFQEPQTADRMRSACETLSYILEPLRQELKQHFMAKDVEDFFQIVNSFDIRHNKEHTKDIVHQEQFEWVFYSLLNTINTFVKLKRRLG